MISALEASLARRQPLLTEHTNAVRLIDGEGDGLPGVYLETFADRWLLSTKAQSVPDTLRGWLERMGFPTYWKRLDQHQKESPAQLCGPEVSDSFTILENSVRYEISFQSGYSQGIFLDQRDNRAELRRLCMPGSRVLNTFAYTGAFSVAAALGGAETTTLDLSQPYLDWAKRNLLLNGIDAEAHHFCKGDTFHWLRRFAKQGRKFDLIVLDPPTFSRDDKGHIFRVEKHFGQLAALAARALAPRGSILCCTNFRALSPHAFERMLLDAAPARMRARHRSMPADFTGHSYLKSVWLQW